MLDEEVEQYLQDPALAAALRQVIEADHNIDGLTTDLVEKLEHYQQRYKELTLKIKQLEAELALSENFNTDSAKKSAQLTKSRL